MLDTACLYRRVDADTFVRYDPCAVPGSDEEYVVVPADRVPPLALAAERVRLSQEQQRLNPGSDFRKAAILAMLQFQERAHAAGDPEAADPYLQVLSYLARNPDEQEKVQLSWIAQPTSRGKYGIKAVGVDDHAGRVEYGAEAQRVLRGQNAGRTLTGRRAVQQFQGKRQEAPSRTPATRLRDRQRAMELLSRAPKLAGGLADHEVEELANHLPALTVHQLRKARVLLDAAWDGKRLNKTGMVNKLMEHVRKRVDSEMKAAGMVPEPVTPKTPEAAPTPPPEPPSVNLNDPAALGAAATAAAAKLRSWDFKVRKPGDFLPHNVPLRNVYDALSPQLGGATFPQFKEAVVKSFRAGKLQLEPIDMRTEDAEQNHRIQSSEVMGGAYHAVSVPTNYEPPRTPEAAPTPPRPNMPPVPQFPKHVEVEPGDRPEKTPEAPAGKVPLYDAAKDGDSLRLVGEDVHASRAKAEDAARASNIPGAGVIKQPGGWMVAAPHETKPPAPQAGRSILNDPKALAAAAHAAARRLPDVGGGAFDPNMPAHQRHRAAVGEVYDEMLRDGSLPKGTTFEDFGRAMVAAHQAGTLEMSRFDLPQTARPGYNHVRNTIPTPTGGEFNYLSTPTAAPGEPPPPAKPSAVNATSPAMAGTPPGGAAPEPDSHAAQLAAIPPGDSRFIDGHRVRRLEGDRYQIELGGKYLTTDAATVAKTLAVATGKQTAPTASGGAGETLAPPAAQTERLANLRQDTERRLKLASAPLANNRYSGDTDATLGETHNRLARRLAASRQIVKREGEETPAGKQAKEDIEKFEPRFAEADAEFKRRIEAARLKRRLDAIAESEKTGKLTVTEGEMGELLAKQKDAYREAGLRGKVPYSPEHFRTSDLTGAKVRHFVELPNGQIAHPDELILAQNRGRLKVVPDAEKPSDFATARVADAVSTPTPEPQPTAPDLAVKGNEDSRQWWHRLSPDAQRAALAALDKSAFSPRKQKLFATLPGQKYDADFQGQSVIDAAFRAARDQAKAESPTPTVEPAKTAPAPAEEPTPTEPTKKLKDRKKPINRYDERTVLQAVIDKGGIDPHSHAFKGSYEDMRRAVQDGIPIAAFKKGGNGLDALAEELESDGYIKTPDDKHPSEHLLDLLREGAYHRHADLTKEYENAYQEYIQAQIEAEKHHSAAEIAEAVRSGAHAGAHQGAENPLGEHGQGADTEPFVSFRDEDDEPREPVAGHDFEPPEPEEGESGFNPLELSDEDFARWIAAGRPASGPPPQPAPAPTAPAQPDTSVIAGELADALRQPTGNARQRAWQAVHDKYGTDAVKAAAQVAGLESHLVGRGMPLGHFRKPGDFAPTLAALEKHAGRPEAPPPEKKPRKTAAPKVAPVAALAKDPGADKRTLAAFAEAAPTPAAKEVILDAEYNAHRADSAIDRTPDEIRRLTVDRLGAAWRDALNRGDKQSADYAAQVLQHFGAEWHGPAPGQTTEFDGRYYDSEQSIASGPAKVLRQPVLLRYPNGIYVATKGQAEPARNPPKNPPTNVDKPMGLGNNTPVEPPKSGGGKAGGGVMTTAQAQVGDIVDRPFRSATPLALGQKEPLKRGTLRAVKSGTVASPTGPVPVQLEWVRDESTSHRPHMDEEYKDNTASHRVIATMQTPKGPVVHVMEFRTPAEAKKFYGEQEAKIQS